MQSFKFLFLSRQHYQLYIIFPRWENVFKYNLKIPVAPRFRGSDTLNSIPTPETYPGMALDLRTFAAIFSPGWGNLVPRVFWLFGQRGNAGDIKIIERFDSRVQHPCKFIGTLESVCLRKEFNSHRTGLEHQHGRRFIVLEHQYGRHDVM